ncbi:protein-serine/threonine phosphatase [Ranunculus cassubicifolius]
MRLGLKSVVYHGDFCLGEVEIFSTTDQNVSFPNNEIRINYISQQSERCLPLSILQTISLNTVRFKLNSTSPPSIASQSDLATLYYSCLRELKTAVIVMGGEELHLVAMMSKQEKDKLPCFWGCSVPIGIYGYCLGLLNLRCLSIVFDLDETLIVANTMRSFEDRIEFLQKRLEIEDDPLRVSGMSAELRRYVEDRSLLKQYIETDSVVDNGKLVKVQFEEVRAQPIDKERIVRPIIRLKERNIVLTRINPEVRDTSVLVRLRPAWEDLRSYLNAKGRKRFEVYVCTMAERDYALEMWRLLDPEAHLIHSNQLPSRVVCVKSGARKSLSSVFHNGVCHPKMAMVIDDRLKVWEDTDQPRVHVVPAFTPYYAPQAETANAVPVLCVARNVACNVRAGFFKEFDENLLRRIFEMSYEDDVATLPSSPDVSDFLLPEDTVFVPNGNKDTPFPEGMRDAEVEERLNKVDVSHPVDFATPAVPKVPDSRPEASQQPASLPSNDVSLELSKANVPLQKSGLLEASSKIEVNPPELDPDKRRRFFGMQYVRDTRAQNSSDLSFSKPPANASPAIQSSRGWLLEEDSTSDQINNQSASVTTESDASQEKQQVHQNLPLSKAESALPGTSSRVPEVKIEETLSRQEGKKLNHSLSIQSLRSGDITTNQATKEFGSDSDKAGVLPSYLYIGVLQEIGRRCGSKIEFRSVVNTSKDLQFSVEVLFTGEKIAAGSGKTKKDAQQQAAENALRTLADEYRAYESGSMNRDLERLSLGNDNGFLWDDPGPDDASPSAYYSGPGSGAGVNSFETQEARKRPNSPRLHFRS